MSPEAAIQFLEEENRRFQNHWVWRRLGCRPDQFFAAFHRYRSALAIPAKRWELALQRAKEASQTRTREQTARRNTPRRDLWDTIQV